MTDVTAASTEQPPARALPLFYRVVRPVEPKRHATMALPEPATFGFAATTNSVPINGQEFVPVQKHYPIVFARTPDLLIALALMGLQRDENLFVDSHGRWAANTYIPGYIRRYPFVFIEAPDKRFALAVEQSYLVENGRRRLFDEQQKPTSILQGALAFCGSYQKGHADTLEFYAALLKADVLIERQADASSPHGQKIRLSGFHIIDKDRWNSLPLSTMAEWRSKGWLEWAYAHIFSQSNWRGLAQRSGTALVP